MKPTLVVQIALLTFGVSALSEAQEPGDRLMEAPTELSRAVSASNAAVEVIGNIGRIDTIKAVAEIAAIEVSLGGGGRERGLRISLRAESQSDSIYLGIDQAVQLRDELGRFDGRYDIGSTCDAASYCGHGIARCRPSQTIPQAICPGVYSDQGEVGVLLSTPQGRFRFTSVQGIDFVGPVNAALEVADAVSN